MSDSDGTTECGRLRRTSRLKKPSLKAMESTYISKLETAGYVAPVSSDENFDFLDEDDPVTPEKPKLLHENEVVHGEDLFSFEHGKRTEGLKQKIAEATKTPHALRNKLRKQIIKEAFEDSGSEYEASSSPSSESDSTEEEDSSPDSEEEQEPKKGNKTPAKNVKFSDTNRTQKSRSKNKTYEIQTDEYFANFASNKIKTSNNTLDKLETPRLPRYQLQQLLANMKLSKEHNSAINNLVEAHKSQFQKWLYVLNENFNILLYGLGSKRNILNTFRKEYLDDQPVIVVNGYFPTVSIKNILGSIIVDLLELTEPSNVNDCCDLIENELNLIEETQLYLIVHNIDGETLRNSKTQGILARLASIKNVHLIASLDHINAPLIWDHNKLSKFNYIWWDVTSFLPYSEETSFEQSMMVQQSGALALSSLRNVFASLTANSKVIYLKIAKHQVENSSQYYQGLAFKDLYESCRESFIVSSDLALRAQLSEFLDHKMVKIKRSIDDGGEYLVVPLQNALLKKFLEEHS